MDCNKTSWGAYSDDSSEEESKQNESPLIIEAKKKLFLRKYPSCPLEEKELIEVFVQSNFDEFKINLTIDKKLKEQLKIKNNILKNEKNKKIEEEKKKNQSRDSWKEAKQNNNTQNINNNNQKYKKYKYKGNNNYSSNYYQHNSRYYYQNNKKHYKHGKNYKPYNRQKNYIEREIEYNSKPEIDNDINEDYPIEKNISLSPKFSTDSNSKNSKNNLDVNSQENIEETNVINNLASIHLDLAKSQSEELNHNNFDLQDVGIKLFPGIYKQQNQNFNSEYEKNNNINNINSNNNNYINIDENLNEEKNKKPEDIEKYGENNICLINKNDFKQNFLHKTNSCSIKHEQKNGLALAMDYYASILESKDK